MHDALHTPNLDLRWSRGAAYIRMSTDHQKYSPANQRSVLEEFAAVRHIAIVRSYFDEGRSGLSIAGRDALRALIADVQTGQADFDCVLVYDVSRWGRFQDVDESAYYEFICRQAGIDVHYCAEEFANDGSLASTLLKSISRVGAAKFSRDLSKRVFLAHSYSVSLGFWRGAPAGFGLRRQAIDETGRPRGILQAGEQKHFKTDRVVLVPGPPDEIAIVRRIFTDFVARGKTRTEIANTLNQAGIANGVGRPWQSQTIGLLLRNEKYLGHNVFNRRSSKLSQKSVDNPPEMWVRHDKAFAPIVPAALFAKAQTTLAELARGRHLTDRELLDKLSALLRRKGRLSMKILAAAKDMPDWTVYKRRFGSLMQAYERIGYEANPRYQYARTGAAIDGLINDTAALLITRLKLFDLAAVFLPELYLLTIGSVTLSIAVAWSVADGAIAGRRSRRWVVRKRRFARSDLTLIIRMDASNASVMDYFLQNTCKLPLSRDQSRLRISDRHFGQYRHDTSEAVLIALKQAVIG